MTKGIKNKWAKLKLNKKFTLIIICILIIPFIVFSLLLFNIVEENTIKEKSKSMEVSMKEDYEQIIKNVNSINMATQFILSDQRLISYLKDIEANRYISTRETLDFYNLNIAFLERMVNNNPYLYQIRVYSESNEVQEMMPILYRKDRMKKLSWAKDLETNGWKFDYIDTIFDSFVIEQDKKLLSLVTPIYDYSKGKLGTIEAAMTMETMFPSLYEGDENEWNFFVDSNGNIYGGNNDIEEFREYIDSILERINNSDDDSMQEVYYSKFNGKAMIFGYIHTKEISGTLVSVQSAEKELQSIYSTRNYFIIMIFVILFILIGIINLAVNKLLRQLYVMIDSMRQVQKGDLSVVTDVKSQDEIGEIAEQFNKMLSRIRQLMKENIQREVLAKDAELRALQNQINAHFIYNVLESIKMMAEIKGEYEISDSVTILGKLLRYSMKWNSKTVSVREEIDYMSNYLALMNLRYDYEIYLSLNIEEIVYEQQIPKMSLQPIVENAIYHGIEDMAEDTNIYIKGYTKGKDCIIEITDAGKGMSENIVETIYKKLSGEIEVSDKAEGGIGLKNVHDRIQMSFGESYGVEIYSEIERYTKVKVIVPLTSSEEDES